MPGRLGKGPTLPAPKGSSDYSGGGAGSIQCIDRGSPAVSEYGRSGLLSLRHARGGQFNERGSVSFHRTIGCSRPVNDFQSLRESRPRGQNAAFRHVDNRPKPVLTDDEPGRHVFACTEHADQVRRDRYRPRAQPQILRRVDAARMGGRDPREKVPALFDRQARGSRAWRLWGARVVRRCG